MRKVDEIKKEQGFVKKAPNCSNCQYFTSKIVPLKWNPDYKQEKNLRCSIGNFKVGKSNWCKLHKFKKFQFYPSSIKSMLEDKTKTY